MDRVVVILIVGVAGGLLAKNFGLPGGPVVGSMLGAGLAAVLFPGHFIIPPQIVSGFSKQVCYIFTCRA